jgi:glycosyltransferase involved in cell wall biosynthesis
MKTSVIIPSRGERFMPQTVNDIFAKAAGEIEVIVILDGYWPAVMPAEHPNLHYIHFTDPRGMRNAINSGAAVASADVLLKCDAHCMFAPAFDEVIGNDLGDNQIMIPRRKRLDAEAWQIQDVGKPDIDAHYMSSPLTNPDGFSMHGCIWPEWDRRRLDVLIDETPSFQGSFWSMRRRHWDRLGGMSEEGYGTFTQEPTEIGMKTWLGGGQVLVNKKTWYAHLHKGKKFGRGYHQDKGEILRGHEYSARYWMNDKWTGAIYPFEWFVDKWPMPTWTQDWKTQWKGHPFYEHR